VSLVDFAVFVALLKGLSAVVGPAAWRARRCEQPQPSAGGGCTCCRSPSRTFCSCGCAGWLIYVNAAHGTQPSALQLLCKQALDVPTTCRSGRSQAPRPRPACHNIVDLLLLSGSSSADARNRSRAWRDTMQTPRTPLAQGMLPTCRDTRLADSNMMMAAVGVRNLKNTALHFQRQLCQRLSRDHRYGRLPWQPRWRSVRELQDCCVCQQEKMGTAWHPLHVSWPSNVLVEQLPGGRLALTLSGPQRAVVHTNAGAAAFQANLVAPCESWDTGCYCASADAAYAVAPQPHPQAALTDKHRSMSDTTDS
jgi:hypothetical protein